MSIERELNGIIGFVEFKIDLLWEKKKTRKVETINEELEFHIRRRLRKKLSVKKSTRKKLCIIKNRL